MRTMRLTFQRYKGSAPYKVGCSICGKLLKRTATEEHTVNPFNKNEDGSVKTVAQVQASAQAAAEEMAIKLSQKPTTCRDCDEAPMRELLLEMAAKPDECVPEPVPYWGSAMHYLFDREQVERAYTFRNGVEGDFSEGNFTRDGYRITELGKARAAKLLVQSRKIAA